MDILGNYSRNAVVQEQEPIIMLKTEFRTFPQGIQYRRILSFMNQLKNLRPVT